MKKQLKENGKIELGLGLNRRQIFYTVFIKKNGLFLNSKCSIMKQEEKYRISLAESALRGKAIIVQQPVISFVQALQQAQQ